MQHTKCAEYDEVVVPTSFNPHLSTQVNPAYQEVEPRTLDEGNDDHLYEPLPDMLLTREETNA